MTKPSRFERFKAAFQKREVSPQLIARAKRLAAYAHMPWITGFFFLIFFLDSFLMIIPSDPLLGLTVNLVPRKKRQWVLASSSGALLGLLIFMFLSMSSFQPAVVGFLETHDLSNRFHEIRTHAHTYGYANIAIGVFTIIPAIVCLVGGIVIGLNPTAVFLIVATGRVVRLITILLLFKGFWTAARFSRDTIQKRHHKEKS